MKIVRVRYEGKTYRAYRTPYLRDYYTLLDVPWGWECSKEMVNRGYQREFRNQKQWNVLTRGLKVIKEIYLGGE